MQSYFSKFLWVPNAPSMTSSVAAGELSIAQLAKCAVQFRNRWIYENRQEVCWTVDIPVNNIIFRHSLFKIHQPSHKLCLHRRGSCWRCWATGLWRL